MEIISDCQPPPIKLRLQLSGEASEKQSSKAGVYSLQSSLVNGFPYWNHDSSDNAIWMYGQWKIAPNEYIGTDISGIQGPFGIEEWPNNISSKWQFASGGKWNEAECGDIVFEDCSPKGNFAKNLKIQIILRLLRNLCFIFQIQHQDSKTHLLLESYQVKQFNKKLVSLSLRNDLMNI